MIPEHPAASDYVLVPREPDDTMKKAGWGALNAASCYVLMIGHRPSHLDALRRAELAVIEAAEKALQSRNDKPWLCTCSNCTQRMNHALAALHSARKEGKT